MPASGETFWPFVGHVEGAFEYNADSAEHAFAEEPTYPDWD
jgi:hypothetical protein